MREKWSKMMSKLPYLVDVEGDAKVGGGYLNVLELHAALGSSLHALRQRGVCGRIVEGESNVQYGFPPLEVSCLAPSAIRV